MKKLLATEIEDRASIEPSPLLHGVKPLDAFRELSSAPREYIEEVKCAFGLCLKGEILDRKANFEGALEHYTSGLDRFMQALDLGRGVVADEYQDALRHEVKKYLARAEEIKTHVSLLRTIGRGEAASDPKKCAIM